MEFDYFRVGLLEIVVNLVRAHFQDIGLCVNTAGFTKGWQRLEIGVMAGCTIFPLAFKLAMEIIIRATKWVVGRERQQTGIQLPPGKAYMDDLTLVTITVPCTKRLLDRINGNPRWASMKVKPIKS